MPLEERRHNQSDQVAIRESLEARDEAEVGMSGIQTRQRIDLDEMGACLSIATDVDAAAIAAAQRPPRGERHIARGPRFWITNHVQRHALFPMLLVLIGVAGLRALQCGCDLHYAQHSRLVARSGDADGELAPWKVSLDQHR